MIHHCWAGHGTGGARVGVVFLVVGDENEDIFDGLAITHHTGFAFHHYARRPHNVKAAKYGEIDDSGRVTLTISCEECRHLPVHDPPESAQISPENAHF